MDPIKQLRDRLSALVAEQQKIVATAQARGGEFSDEENAALVDIEKKQAKLENDIARMVAAAEAQARLDAPAPRLVEPAPTVSTATAVSPTIATSPTMPREYHPITGRDLAATSPTHGFETAFAWLKAIQGAQSNPAMTDRRLTNAKAAASTFTSEGSGPDAGWALPPEYAQGILDVVAGQASLLGRMKPMQSNSNVYQVPVDETTDWGTTGPQAAKTAEGAAATASSLVLQGRTVSLYKATAMLNVSEELASDNPAVVQHITRSMSGRLQAIVERWILNGSGAGEPLGILKAPAYVSVAADGSQTAGTITKTNVSKMIGRCLPGTGCFFAVSPSANIAIMDLLLAAPGNRADNLQGNLSVPSVLGMYPVVPTMEAPAVGTVGDCTLVCPDGFLTLVKGGIQNQSTIYFYFDQGLQTLRSYIRIGQTPILSAAVTPKLDTATTLSHCVGIAAR